MSKKIFSFVLIFVLLISLSGCGLSSPSQDPRKPITINYWRVWDDSGSFREIIDKYEELHPNITINYRKLRYEDYEDELVNAMAEDRGPDIFTIHNTWMKAYQPKMAYMPEEVKMSKAVMEGVINKKKVLTTETKKTLTIKELENKFLDVIYKDVILPDEKGIDKIYGLPLSVDTLAMYYNKDLINNANIAEVPKYWDRDFQETVKKMTKQSNEGEIIQSGVALGGARNIEASTDILSILMMQSGATMMNDEGSVMFHSSSRVTKGYNPGPEALEFYTDFANPGKEVYCWNDRLDDSLDMFAEGKLGIMFGYAYHLPIIKSQAPKLNFNTVKLPQIKGSEVNFANYWVETVSHKSKNQDAAWDFLQFATAEEQVKSYLDYVKKPTALRSLVNEQIDDTEIGVFAEQLLTSKSWYSGYNAHATTEAFKQMVEETNNHEEEIETVMRRAVERIQQTVNKK